MDRPLGVKSVTNPFPTSTSEDPENLESARINAPLKVLDNGPYCINIMTLKILQDLLQELEKQKHLKSGTVPRLIVHLSIATSSGQRLDPLTCENITKSIERFKDPHIPFMLDSFIKKTFSLTAKIKVSEDMLSDKVLEAVKNIDLGHFFV